MRYSIFTLVFLGTWILGIASPADSLNRANQLYSEAKYQQAIHTYENILASGFESAELYFNLGNAYYRTKEIAPAMLNFERAQLLAPGDDDIKFNIEMTNQLIVDKIAPLPKPFFQKWKSNLVNLNSTDGWAKWSIICFILGLILLAVFMFSPTALIKKITFSALVIVFILSVSTLFLAKVQHNLRNESRGAVVFSPTVTIKASPNESGTAIFVIHEGLKVQIVDAVGDWYQIKIADGNVGWIKKEELQVI